MGATRKSGGSRMDVNGVQLRLNQQQLELIDNSVKAGEAESREDLIRRALKEFAETHLAKPADKPA
jgi:Arc/MetJ-type ribon-helix-helix transcriptional regulator